MTDDRSGHSGAPESKSTLCEQVLAYSFRDRELLVKSLTHASVSRTRLESNERLEFLGDAVLGTLICEELYKRFPDAAEGELTRLKSSLVSRTTCATITNEFQLDQCLIVGKGLSSRQGVPSSILAGLLEAVIGAVYLDGGIEPTREIVSRLFASEVERVVGRATRNFKSALQQLSQKVSGETPSYQLLDEKGPDHSKCFQVAAVIGRNSYPAAWGASKKEAEQQAAKNALLVLDAES